MSISKKKRDPSKEFLFEVSKNKKLNEMEKNEIKKILYVNKPTATFLYVRKGHVYYKAIVNDIEIMFDVPVSDMGDADFFSEMQAQHLNRWIV
jgi:hypothetical protein